MKYADITPTMRAFVGAREAFRKLGYAAKDLSLLVARSARHGGTLSAFVFLRAQDKTFSLECGPVKSEALAKAEYDRVVESINSGAVTQADMERIYTESEPYRDKGMVCDRADVEGVRRPERTLMKPWHAARERMVQPRPSQEREPPSAELDDPFSVLGQRVDTAAVAQDVTAIHDEAMQQMDASATLAIRWLALDKLEDFEVCLGVALHKKWDADAALRLQDEVFKLGTDEEVTKAFLEWHVDEKAREAWTRERLAALRAKFAPPPLAPVYGPSPDSPLAALQRLSDVLPFAPIEVRAALLGRIGPAHCACGHHALEHDLAHTLMTGDPAPCEAKRCACKAYALDHGKTADVLAAMEAGFL